MFLAKLQDALSQGDFVYQDFQLSTSNSYSSYVTLSIKYKYQPRFVFSGTIYTSGEKYTAEIIPGAVIKKEKKTDLDHHEFLEVIDDWLHNISHEMKFSPLARKFDEHEKFMQDIAERIEAIEDKDELFTASEGAEFIQRLDMLEKAFSDKLQSEVEDAKKLQDELNKLHNEINTLKIQLDALTKKNWYLSFSTRLYLWYQRNPIVMRSIAGATRELLPEPAKAVVTDEVLDQFFLSQQTTIGKK